MFSFYPPIGLEHFILLNQARFLSLNVMRQLSDLKFLYGFCIVDCPDLLSESCFAVRSYNTSECTTFYCPTARTSCILMCTEYVAHLTKYATSVIYIFPVPNI